MYIVLNLYTQTKNDYFELQCNFTNTKHYNNFLYEMHIFDKIWEDFSRALPFRQISNIYH